MPETDNFDLSSLASILQNEDTLRSLRQMAGAMGMENQLEGALQNLSQSQAASGNSNSAPPAHPQPDHRQENHHQPNHQNVSQSQSQPDNAAGMNLNSPVIQPSAAAHPFQRHAGDEPARSGISLPQKPEAAPSSGKGTPCRPGYADYADGQSAGIGRRGQAVRPCRAAGIERLPLKIAQLKG